MRRSEIAAIVAGFLVAAGVAIGLPTSEPDTQATEDLARSVAESVPSAVTTVEVTPSLPEVDGLPDSVAGLLGAKGLTELVPRAELEAGIPASVVDVLIEHGAVLRLPATTTSEP
jgi:hypothetical protein